MPRTLALTCHTTHAHADTPRHARLVPAPVPPRGLRPEEKLPPYAIIAGVALEDVSSEMGPTQFCARMNKRFYDGERCGLPVAAGVTAGSVYLFDYKTLHRGPGNSHPERSR